MAIKLGSNTISKAYLGSSEIQKMYLGSSLVFDGELQIPTGISLEEIIEGVPNIPTGIQTSEYEIP